MEIRSSGTVADNSGEEEEEENVVQVQMDGPEFSDGCSRILGYNGYTARPDIRPFFLYVV